MKKLVAVTFMLYALCSANAQSTYSLKDSDISFTSNTKYLAVYNNPGYAVYKNDYVEVTMSIIRFLNINGLEHELKKLLPEKEYTVYFEEDFAYGSSHQGVFCFATRKGFTTQFAKGLILKDNKTVLVEIEFESSLEDEVKAIVNSLTEMKSPANASEAIATSEPLASYCPTATNNQNDIQGAKNQPSSFQQPQSNGSSPKHPPVSHPKLVKLTQAHRQEFVDAHNRWRSDVGVKPLGWSADLENYAAEWAVKKGEEGCDMQHRSENDYGENLYWSSGMAFSPKGTVDSWGSEIKDYNDELVGQEKAMVGHYTQVVWSTTTEVGCAAFQCGSALLVVCNYNPPGNWVGQHPYKKVK